MKINQSLKKVFTPFPPLSYTMKFQISVGLCLFFFQIFANPYGLIPHPTIIKFWTFCHSLLLFRTLLLLKFDVLPLPNIIPLPTTIWNSIVLLSLGNIIIS